MEDRGKRKDFVFPFEKLDVWNMAVDPAEKVLDMLESFPSNRHFRLISQMEPAVTSIAQNIAEGKGRQFPVCRRGFVARMRSY